MVQKTVSVMLEKTREEAEVVLEEMTTDELVLSNAVSETLLDHRLDGQFQNPKFWKNFLIHVFTFDFLLLLWSGGDSTADEFFAHVSSPIKDVEPASKRYCKKYLL